MERFQYDGRVYVRPIGRGVMLLETNLELDEALSALVDADAWGGREAHLRIVIEVVSVEQPDAD